MRRQFASLTAFVLAACSAEPADLRVMMTSAPETASTIARAMPETAAQPEPDPAEEARGFFFMQAGLLLGGAKPEDDPQLAEVLRAMGRADLAPPPAEPQALAACPDTETSPLDLLSQAATGRQVVVIETRQTAPELTAFAEDAVTRLAAEGFSAYADEGLTLGPGGAAHPEVLLVTEGRVVRDAAQGRLLRAVKRNHFTLVDAGVWWTGVADLAGLEAGELATRQRSELAAQIARRIFVKDPEARVIVHVEQVETEAERAAFLSDLASPKGQPPLVITFERCDSAAQTTDVAPVQSPDLPATPPNELTIPVPAAAWLEGRQTSGPGANEVAVTLPADLIPASLPVLIEARRMGDPALAVPEDRLMLFPGDALPLILRPGDYRIEAWTQNGPLSAPVPVIVN